MKPAKQLFEECLQEIDIALRCADLSLAPFPLVGDAAIAYLFAECDTLQWVLEMLDE
jgi:hypothetical protein